MKEDDGDTPDDSDYRPPEPIEPGALRSALCSLTFLGNDPFLSMQAFNLDAVDQFIMVLEYDVLKELIDSERTPIASASFLNAQSQMWLFMAYEILRTWRQRCRDIIKWSNSGGLRAKIEALTRDEGHLHLAKQMRAKQLEEVIKDANLIEHAEADLMRIHILFAQLEHLRMALAKHEVRRQSGSVALRPGYGRINYFCGSLDYELENGRYSIGTLNRRNVADSIRALPNMATPLQHDLSAFDEFMRGPKDE